MNHITPITPLQISSEERARVLGQRGLVVWMTGLSGAGKSTLALETERALLQQGKAACVLDGDNLRTGLNKDLGFSEADRLENMRRTAEVARLMADAGLLELVSLISPLTEGRKTAAGIIGKSRFREVFVNCPLEVTKQRDVKGLYAKAAAGEISNFTGVGAAYEVPEQPHLELRTDKLTIKQCTDLLLEMILPLIAV